MNLLMQFFFRTVRINYIYYSTKDPPQKASISDDEQFKDGNSNQYHVSFKQGTKI